MPRVGEEQRAVLADRLEVVAAADGEAAVELAEHVVREAQRAREGDVDAVAADHLLAVHALRLGARHQAAPLTQ